MSGSKVLSALETAPRFSDSAISSVTVAVLTTAIGWFLIWQTVWQPHHLLASLASFGIIAGIVNFFWSSYQPASRFGEANQATLVRSGLVCVIGSSLLTAGQMTDISWYLVALIAVALILDAVDGYLARRLKLCSTFGARFDMEIDALLLLVLSSLVWRTDQAGAWVLAIGLMRYAYVAAGWIWPFLRQPLEPSWRRKCICALQGIALFACLLPPLDQTGASVIAAFALVTLAVSFGLDIKALLRREASQAVTNLGRAS